MNRLRLLLGLAVAVGIGAVAVNAARRVRRRLVPAWVGLDGILADVVLTVSLVTVVAQVTGAVGVFGAPGLAIALLVASAPAWWWGLPGPGTSRSATPGAARDVARAGCGTERFSEPAWTGWVAAGAVAVVLAAWSRGLPTVLRHGTYDWDSVWYHLPVAADFVRDGTFLDLHLYGADIAVATYPFASSVLHAVGMVITGSDILSPLLNYGWAAVLLAAARSIGHRFGCPNLVMCGAATVLVFPVATKYLALTAMSEVMGLACLLLAVAFVAAARSNTEGRGPVVLAGLALGLAASSKLTFLVPAVLVGTGIVVIEVLRAEGRGRLWRAAWPLGLAATSTGAFWYVRNVWRFGSPIPELHLGIGSLALPSVHIHGETGPMLPTLVEGLLSGSEHLALDIAFGGLWPVVLAVPLLALATIPIRQPVPLRVLTIVAALAFLVGLLTPQYVVDGDYINIQSNTRYLLAGLLLATVSCSALLGSSRRTHRVGFAVVLTVFAVSAWRSVMYPVSSAAGYEALDSRPIWVVVLVPVALAVRWFATSRAGGGTCSVRIVAVGAVAVVALLVAVLPTYVAGHYSTYRADRYAQPPRDSSLYGWAQSHSHRHIAVEPYDEAEAIGSEPTPRNFGQRLLLFAYPLMGRDLSNAVSPIAHFDGTEVVVPTTCSQWWTELRRLGATNVLVWDDGVPGDSDAERWTEASPATREVRREVLDPKFRPALVLYEIDPRAEPRCAPTGSDPRG